MIKLYIRGTNDSDSLYEECIYIETYLDLTEIELEKIKVIISEFNNQEISNSTYLKKQNIENPIYEIGPILNFSTPWCTNAIEILKSSGIDKVERIEKTFRFTNKVEANAFFDKMTQIYYDSIDTFNVKKDIPDSFMIQKSEIEYYNKLLGLSLDSHDIEYYKQILPDQFTNVELFDLSQSNSEHSRHWFFNGQYVIKKTTHFMDDKSLFKRVKETNTLLEKNNSLNAFSDNASCIEGYDIRKIEPTETHKYSNYKDYYFTMCPTHTAETHNFPTGICPFPGATTGTGGRIRDSIAIGKGGNIISGYVGYSVGEISFDYNDLDEKSTLEYPYETPRNILIQASNGASDYGNKIGEPVISGYTRSFYQNIGGKRIEYVKPIMYCGGIGSVYMRDILKDKPEYGDLVIRIGGPAYSIGLGGGSASSRNQDKENEELDYNAVQRGDPQMENKVCRFVRACNECEENPIKSIHDQGSGGMGNVTKEIVEPNGAIISLENVKLGDKFLSSNEIWNAEYQEQVSILIHPKDTELIKEIAKRENVNIDFAGYVTNTGRIEVYNNRDSINKMVDLDLDKVLNNVPRKIYHLDISYDNILTPLICNPSRFNDYLEKILKSVNVGSKRFLTNKVDRSVTGLIAQQQCIGPFHTPLSDYSLTAFSMNDTNGIACSIGEQPIKGLLDIEAMVGLTIGEMLTNLMFVKISNFTDIKCLGNWMWSPKLEGQGYLLYEAVKEVEEILKILKIGIDGGKDSLSMNTKVNDELVMSPNTLVMSSYVLCPDITCKVTPDFKKVGSKLLFIDLGYYNYNIGGSIFAQCCDKLGAIPPQFKYVEKFPVIFNYIQKLLSKGKILSGHDRSDGGLITTLIEMSLSSYYGCKINIKSDVDYLSYMFNEELGLIIEVDKDDIEEILLNLNNYCPTILIGETTEMRDLAITFNDELLINRKIVDLWKMWEYPSYQLELEQCDPYCAKNEYDSINTRIPPFSSISPSHSELLENLINRNDKIKYNVGIIRECGSNGDKEMAVAFYAAGFNVYDINMSDLESNVDLFKTLDLRGLAFVGGFSYSDVFGAGVGWGSRIMNNERLYAEFMDFFNNEQNFSLGICNGCQVLSLLGILPEVRFLKNKSNKFESRFVSLKVTDSNCIFTKDMEGTIFGMWSSHGEGRMIMKYNNYNELDNLIPFKYVDDCGNITEKYPFNPNGSRLGNAGICSHNGRHLALMPHPERCFLKWQCPYIDPNIDAKLEKYSPWVSIFRNAYIFCENQ